MLTAALTALTLVSLACVLINVLDMIDDVRRDSRRNRRNDTGTRYTVPVSMRDTRPIIRRPRGNGSI